jgi:type II secretory pathway component PulC
MIIQLQTISGEQVENAKWDVPVPAGLQEGQSFAILLPFEDKELSTYISKVKNSECYVDLEEGKTSAVLSFRVSRIRHMLTINSQKIETLCYLTPTHRATEQVMIYILSPAKADPRLKRAIKGN